MKKKREVTAAKEKRASGSYSKSYTYSKGPGFLWWLRGKESSCNAGDTGLIPGLGRSGFLDSSVGKESACNAGDPSSIPRSERSPGEGIGCPPQYPWASLVAQLVKNPPAMRETWVRSLGWEDPLEKGKATHSSVLAWRIHGSAESQT